MKTIDSIIADIRANAEAQYEAWQGDPNSFPDGIRWSNFLLEVAKQIEDARKIEKALQDSLLACKDKTTLLPDPEYVPPPCPVNCAALRAALEAVREAFDSNDFGAMGDHPRSDVLDMADAVRRKVEAALAAPARNCDRFCRWETAKEVFESENWQRLGHINPYLDVIKWLLAPAEGGAE